MLMEEVKELKELVKGNPKLVEPEKFLTKKQAEEFSPSKRKTAYLYACTRANSRSLPK